MNNILPSWLGRRENNVSSSDKLVPFYALVFIGFLFLAGIYSAVEFIC